MNKKPSLEDLEHELTVIDTGAIYIGIYGPKKNREILFDLDEDGNGEAPYLYLKLYNNHAKFTKGFWMDHFEVLDKFEYKDYYNVEKLAKAIAKSTKRYFRSFKNEWVRVK